MESEEMKGTDVTRRKEEGETQTNKDQGKKEETPR
jgi:hypothetical protein